MTRYLSNVFLLMSVSLIATFSAASTTLIISDKQHEEGSLATTRTTTQQTTRRVMLEDKKRIRIFDSEMRCNSRYRTNPCGPESKCEDTDDGYICTNEYAVHGCIAGCDLHASCVKDEDYGIYHCKCHEGYEKEDEYMRCQPITE
jgi:hypothetical protein